MYFDDLTRYGAASGQWELIEGRQRLHDRHCMTGCGSVQVTWGSSLKKARMTRELQVVESIVEYKTLWVEE